MRAFVQNYTSGPPGVRGVGTRAAIAAGYKPTGAGTEARRLLKNVRIHAEIERALTKPNVTADRVLAEIASMAFADMRDYAVWTDHGVTLKPSATLEHATPITEVSEHVSKEGTAVRIKMGGKVEALAHLAKITRLIRDKGDEDKPVLPPLVFVLSRELGSEPGDGSVVEGEVVRALPAPAAQAPAPATLEDDEEGYEELEPPSEEPPVPTRRRLTRVVR